MLKFGSLKHLVETRGERAACQILEEACRRGDIEQDDWSVRELAETFLGSDWAKKVDMIHTSGFQVFSEETQVGTSVTAFSNITGQLIFNIVNQGWTHSQLIGKMVSTTTRTKFEKEIIPGISTPPVPEGGIPEGAEYPSAGLNEHYWDTPKTIKEGLIIPITKEAIMFDRTGIIVKRAREVGESLAMTKEEQILRAVLGITNTHIFDGVAYNTYMTGPNPWNNLLAAVPLVDYTNIDAARQLLAQMTSPDTGKPLLIGRFDILTMPVLNFTARNIVNATQIRSIALPKETISTNPLPNMGILESAFARQLLIASGLSAGVTDGRWYIGDFKKAFGWFQNWDITVVTAPQNSEPEFTRDIQLRYKASYKGGPVVLEPRAVVQVNAA